MKTLHFPIAKIEEQITERLESQDICGWKPIDTVRTTSKKIAEINQYKMDMVRNNFSSISLRLDIDPRAGRIMNSIYATFLHAFRMDALGSSDWVWRNSENSEMFSKLRMESDSEENRLVTQSAHELAMVKFKELFGVDCNEFIQSQKERINNATNAK